jgi:diacylglycerol kinase
MTKVGFVDSVLLAVKGLFREFSTERNIKIQLVIAAFAVFTAWILKVPKIYLITIIIVCFLVIILEVFNRAFEKLIDLISPEYNGEFGRVKDMVAGVVLLTFVMTSVVGFLILYQPVISLFRDMAKNWLSLLLIFGNIIAIGAILAVNHAKKKN